MEGVVGGEVVLEEREQLDRAAGIVGVIAAREPSQRERGREVGAGGAADAEVDAAGEQCAEHSERLRDLERAVVRQHDPARADADRGGGAGHVCDQHLGGGARDARGVVVLGQPVAVVAERLGGRCELDGLRERLRRGLAGADRAHVEHRQGGGGGRGHGLTLEAAPTHPGTLGRWAACARSSAVRAAVVVLFGLGGLVVVAAGETSSSASSWSRSPSRTWCSW